MPFSQSSRNANTDLKITEFATATSNYVSQVNYMVNKLNTDNIKSNIEQTVQKNQDARREHFLGQLRRMVTQNNDLRQQLNDKLVALPEPVMKDKRVKDCMKDIAQADDVLGDFLEALNTALKWMS